MVSERAQTKLMVLHQAVAVNNSLELHVKGKGRLWCAHPLSLSLSTLLCQPGLEHRPPLTSSYTSH